VNADQPTDPTRGPEGPPMLSVPRPDEPTPADEMTMDRNWLQYLRDCVMFKVDGLDDDQLRWAPTETANSPGQLVVHLGYAERLWFRSIFAGENMDMAWRQHMFEIPGGWGVDQVVAFYRAESAAVDAVLDGETSFDAPSRAEWRPTTLRWAMVHVIEETARHLGHMDITRELIDGRTGR
jgi:uncharacterized damage-inducible protein DinB